MKNEKTSKTIKNVGKGSREEELPHRFARSTLTGGDVMQRAANNYAKKPARPVAVGLLVAGMCAR
jgi:hypothetical protein